MRAAWRVMVAEKTDPKRLVFVDEMGTNISLSLLYAMPLKAIEHTLRYLLTGARTRLCFPA